MKIAIVTDAWLPQVNGVVTTYRQTIRHLEQRGFEILTITPDRYRTMPCPTYPEIRISLVRPENLAATLADFTPQAVHLATEGPLGWAARRACLDADFPFSSAYHTRFPEYLRRRFPIPLRFSYAVLRLFHHASQRVLVSTSALRIELEQRGFRRLGLWSRGVDTCLFHPKEEKQPRRHDPIFTFVGRVAPEKNIEAFLSLELPGRKQVIGEGPDLDRMKALFPEVIFTGCRIGRELVDLLADSSVFVFPSRTDTFGIVQLEAMACGLPVAAYQVGGPISVIRNGENGWMSDDLRASCLKCLDIDPGTCRQFAEKYTWEACTDQFVDNLCMAANPFTAKRTNSSPHRGGHKRRRVDPIGRDGA